MPVYQIETDPGREFWEQVFLSFVAEQEAEAAAAAADQSLIVWKERWKNQIVNLPDFPAPFFPAPSQPKPDIQNLIAAQERVETCKKRVEALQNLVAQMPTELGEAFYAVDGSTAEQQLKDAEQWLSNVQAMMESQP